MAEQLQSLLERIQKDGVEKADAEAARIIEEAKEKAAAIIRDAEQKAKTVLENAEREGETFAARGQRAVEQASRDVILSLGENLNKTVEALVRSDAKGALSADSIADIIATIAATYMKDEAAQVIVPADDAEKIRAHVLSRLSESAADGLTIQGDDRMIAGFRIAIQNGKVEHDFSLDAVTDALCGLLRPQIADIVKKARESN